MGHDSPYTQTSTPMDQQTTFAALRDALAALYPVDEDARRVVADAGLVAMQITFSPRAQTNWHNILAEAIFQARLDALLEIVYADYAANPALVAAYEQYCLFVDQGNRFEAPEQLAAGAGVTIVGDVHIDGGDFIGRDKTIILTGEVAYDVRGLPNPYLGLRSFTYTDRAAYGGREGEIAQAVSALTRPGQQQVLYFVTGASGSGKSSFVQAGLMPALEAFYATRNQPTARALFRPGDAPMTMLADALLQLGAPSLEAYATLPSVPLIVLDQFEELFTQADSGERQRLVQWLFALPTFAARPAHWIATLRSDYLDQLFEIKPLYDLHKGGLDLRVMTVDQIKEAIQKPLWQRFPNGEKRFEATLLNRLAEEAGASATLLPLLQVTLEEIWKRGALTNGAYVNLADAIRVRADQVLRFHDYDASRPQQPRSAEERTAILDTFLDLVNVSLDDDFRRDVRTSRDKRLLPADKQRLIDDLSHARLVSISTEGAHDQPVEAVTIIHEALITNWARLREEVQERRQQLQQRTRFEQQVKEWSARAQHDDYLLTGVYLAQARELARKQDIALTNPLARKFLTRSIDVNEAEQQRRLAEAEARAASEKKAAEAERERALEAEARAQAEHDTARTRSRQWLIGAGLALALLIAIGLGVLWNQQRNNARFLQSYNVAVQALPIANEQPDKALLLALTAEQIQNNLGDSGTLSIHTSLMTTMLSGPRPIAYLRGHTKPVQSVAFSPDSHVLASASDDGTIRLWDMDDRRTLYTLTDHKQSVRSVAFRPVREEYLLASGGDDGAVRLWIWSNLQQAPTATVLLQRDEAVHAVTFTSDGSLLAIATGMTVEVWDFAQHRQRYTLTGHTGTVYGLAFSPDGQKLASTDGKNDLRVWDVATGQPLDTPNPQEDVWVKNAEWMHGVTFGLDNRYVFTGYGFMVGYQDTTDTNGNEIQYSNLTEHTSLMRSMTFNAEGSRFVTASEGRVIGYCYHPYTSCSTIFLRGHNSPVNTVSFSPDNRWLASGGDDGNILLWNALSPYVAQSLPAPILFDNRRGNAVGMAFSPDSKLLAAVYWDNALRIWDVASSTATEIWPRQGQLTKVAFHPNGNEVAITTEYPPLRIWRIDGTVAATLTVNTAFSAVSFSADGKLLAFDDNLNQSLCLWDMIATTPTCQALAPEDAVRQLAFQPLVGSRWLAANAGNKVVLWDVAAHPPISYTLGMHDGGVFSLGFSPDGKRLASGGGDYAIRVWDVETRRLERKLDSGRMVRGVGFSPDGQILAAGNEDWTVRWWDVATWEPLVAPTKTRSNRIESVAFSPDGQYFATGSFDGLIDLWPGTFPAWTKKACQIANRNLTAEEWQGAMKNEPYIAGCPDLPTPATASGS